MDRSKKLDTLEFFFEKKVTNTDELYDFVSKGNSDYINSIEGIKILSKKILLSRVTILKK